MEHFVPPMVFGQLEMRYNAIGIQRWKFSRAATQVRPIRQLSNGSKPEGTSKLEGTSIAVPSHDQFLQHHKIEHLEEKIHEILDRIEQLEHRIQRSQEDESGLYTTESEGDDASLPDYVSCSSESSVASFQSEESEQEEWPFGTDNFVRNHFENLWTADIDPNERIMDLPDDYEAPEEIDPLPEPNITTVTIDELNSLRNKLEVRLNLVSSLREDFERGNCTLSELENVTKTVYKSMKDCVDAYIAGEHKTT